MKETLRKVTSQEGGFLNFLRPWMSAGLKLMKKVVKPMSYSKENFGIRDDWTDNLERKINNIMKVLNLLKNQVYWQKALVKQLK